jgi:hypothetical protein
MTEPLNTYFVIGCIIGDALIGMVIVFILHKLFPRYKIDVLAYIGAGIFNFPSAIFGNASSFLNLLLNFIIGTAIWGTIYAALWRLIFYLGSRHRKTELNELQHSGQQSTEQNTPSNENLFCPLCGFEQPTSNNFCRKCGIKLEQIIPI